MSAARIVLRIGSAMLGAGLFLIAFVSYQLWGTAVVEHGAQSTLLQELRAAVGRDLVAGRAAAPYHPTTSTTVASRPSSSSSTTATSTLPILPPKSSVSPSPQQTVPPTPVFTGYVAPSQNDPASGAPVGYLSIPKISLDEAIVQGVGESQLQSGPGHYPGTPLPGESGNAAIAGHRTTYGVPFYDLNQLQAGDPIYIQTSQGVFQYDVTDSFAVAPSDVSVLSQSSTPTLTLTTCNPRYSASQRLVVKARLVSSQAPPGAVAAPSATTSTAPSRVSGLTQLAGADQSLAGNGQGVVLSVLWGLLTAVFAVGAFLVVRRRTLATPVRIATFVVGTPLTLGTMFLFFEHISSVLPGSF